MLVASCQGGHCSHFSQTDFKSYPLLPLGFVGIVFAVQSDTTGGYKGKPSQTTEVIFITAKPVDERVLPVCVYEKQPY